MLIYKLKNFNVSTHVHMQSPRKEIYLYVSGYNVILQKEKHKGE